jgi:tetratricopeptide (TPR) repeat protein
MVFISYARKTSAPYAVALYSRLRETPAIPAFLDTSDIEAGDRFPNVLADALLRSTVVVVFVEDVYFDRWYCLRELRTALAPFDLALRRNNGGQETERALEHIVIALPAAGLAPAQLDDLPPLLARGESWLGAHQTDQLAELVRRRYAALPQTLAERIGDTEAQSLAREFLSEAVLPEPVSSGREPRVQDGEVPFYAQALPPSLEEGFVGRANDLWRIHFALSTMHHFRPSSGGTIAIEGGAGFGKTRLVLEYFFRFGPRHYRGGNFWVDASGGVGMLPRQFRGILRSLSPGDEDVATAEAGRNYAQDLRRALHARVQSTPVLFVIDNIPEGQHPPPLDEWCPSLGEVSCIITSRAKVSLWSAAVKDIPLSAIDGDSAVAMLTRGLNRQTLAEVQWRKLAEMTGNLPLALELLNRTLRVPGISASQLLARLEEAPLAELERRYAILRPHIPAGSLRGIGETFAISYAILRPTEKKAARLLAHLAPEPVPLRILELLEPQGVKELARVTLVARSFVSPVYSADIQMFGTMHRLLADFLRSRSKSPDAEQVIAATAVASAMEEVRSENPVDWPLADACLPHAVRFFGELACREPVPEVAIRLASTLGAALLVGGGTRRAREILEMSEPWAAARWGAEDDRTLGVRMKLASALKDQGELRRAEVIERRILSYLEDTGEVESNRYLFVLNNLGYTLSLSGKHREALKIRKRHLKLCQSRPIETTMAMMSVNNLAHEYFVIGDVEQAIRMQEFALQTSRQRLGEDHPETLLSMHNLATSLVDDDPERGISLLREVIEPSRRVLGRSHPRTLGSTISLAQALSRQGRHEEAISLLEEAFQASRQKWGDDDQMTLTVMSKLGTILARSTEGED